MWEDLGDEGEEDEGGAFAHVGRDEQGDLRAERGVGRYIKRPAFSANARPPAASLGVRTQHGARATQSAH